MARFSVIRFVCHSRKVLSIASQYGWLPGARYTNLRDVRRRRKIGFVDICWQNYDYDRHLYVVQEMRPLMTVARDVEDAVNLDEVILQAEALARHVKHVVIVPKDPALAPHLDKCIPKSFLLGYSVPTRYGGTPIPPECFQRPVHLLGGRPDVQRELGEKMPVFSLDINRFTLDAAFGDYFDGEKFRPHPVGGYDRCLEDSIKNINALWEGYLPHARSTNGKKNGSRRGHA